MEDARRARREDREDRAERSDAPGETGETGETDQVTLEPATEPERHVDDASSLEAVAMPAPVVDEEDALTELPLLPEEAVPIEAVPIEAGPARDVAAPADALLERAPAPTTGPRPDDALEDLPELPVDVEPLPALDDAEVATLAPVEDAVTVAPATGELPARPLDGPAVDDPGARDPVDPTRSDAATATREGAADPVGPRPRGPLAGDPAPSAPAPSPTSTSTSTSTTAASSAEPRLHGRVPLEPALLDAAPLDALPLVDAQLEQAAPAVRESGVGPAVPTAAELVLPRHGDRVRARIQHAGGVDAVLPPDPASPAAETRRAAAATEAARADARTEVDRAARVLEQVRVRLENGARFASFELAPRELGRLSIRIAMQAGRMAAIVRAESEQTLDLLERHLPELRASLAAQGIEADGLDLALGFEEHANDPKQGRQGSQTRAGRAFRAAVAVDASTATGGPTLPLSDTDGVDTYA